MAIPSSKVWFPGAIVACAVASLALPFAPVYDPWAWLVWGREIGTLGLDTSAGPSWKPLPVLIDVVFAPAGSAADDLWLALSRIGWIAAPVLAATLAARLVFARTLANRLAASWARSRVRRAKVFAGGLAAVGVVLFDDPFTSWTRQFAGGLSEPLLVSFVLGAVHLDLAGRRGAALGLGVAAALLRPEAWPFLTLYGFHLWRSDPALRRSLIGVGVAVPLLWLVPDLIGSGDPFTGASRAREGTGSPPVEALEALGRSLDLVIWPLWIGVVYAVVSARRAGERAIPLLAAGAGAWIALVAVLAAAGYAGIPRFAAPAAAIASVLGAVGIVRMLAALDGMRASDRRRQLAIFAVTGLLALTVAQAVIRTAGIPGELADASGYAEGVDDLAELVERVGPERIRGCGPVTTSSFIAQTPLAWDLDLAIGEVAIRTETAPPDGTVFIDRDASPAAQREIAGAGSPLGSYGHWSAYAVSCAASAARSSAGERTIAGVSGARR